MSTKNKTSLPKCGICGTELERAPWCPKCAKSETTIGELSVLAAGGGHGFMIMDSHGDTLAGVPYDGTGYERDHAQLFAAAPALLAACKMLMGVAEWADRNKKRSITDVCDWSIVRAAIAQAEQGAK